ncbi:MAG TPA: aminopeptidase N [Candidatus Nanopelagicaceae bacterium]
MPGVNLTQSEAIERSRLLKVDSYDVELDLTTGVETFLSRSTVRFTSLKAGASTFIDAVGKRVISATLNGAPLDVSDYDGETVFLPSVATSNELVLEIECMYSKSGEGLHRFVDPADGEVYLYSQFAVADASRAFACFDQPDLKATFAFATIVPSHWEVISNNPVDTIVEINATTMRWAFKRTPVLSTYLAAIVAGPYNRAEDVYVGDKTVPLALYCRKSLGGSLDADEIFKITKQGFAFYEKEFGLAYPFDKYDQVAVAEFNAGAMENAGCVTFAEDYFVFRSKVTDQSYNWRANIILHEMAHMWFGDLVTMTWWDDIWLNESFAEWASYLTLEKATRFTNSWTVFNAERKNWGYRQDQLSSTHPIVQVMKNLETVKGSFDGITYAKGASVLQQLVTFVGKENFFTGLRQYFAKHAWGNTTLNDLLVELEAASGRDLKPWTATWLQTAGVNTLRPEIVIAGDSYSSISIRQEAPLVPAGSTQLRPHRIAVGLYDLKNRALVRRKSSELDIAGALTGVPELAGEKIADLVLLNDYDLSYGKIRFDDRSLKTLTHHLGGIQDPLSRALCWAATWDMLRDGELAASKYVPMAIRALAGEFDIVVVTETLKQLESAVEIFAADAHRTKLRQTLASGLEALLANTDSGSDLQLQYARSFARAAATSTQNARIRDILNGEIAGLTVDTDLRWHLIGCLVERGLSNNAEIDAELVRDNTANGQRYAAFARAAFPDAAVKARAFNSAITEKLSNHIQLSTIRGFQRPLHRDFIRVYVNRYFEMVLDVWNSETYEMAKNVATDLYPMYITSQATLQATEEWLNGSGKNAPDGLRRIMSENRDYMVRALRAKARDAD